MRKKLAFYTQNETLKLKELEGVETEKLASANKKVLAKAMTTKQGH